jgi:hypothetical protein
LAYSSYIGNCSQLLADIGAAKSDAFIPLFIRLQALQEEINRAFQYDKLRQQDELDVEKIDMLCHRFGQQLKQARSTCQPEFWSSGKFQTNSHSSSPADLSI